MLKRIFNTTRTVVVVTVITVLIWLYAEGENIKPRELLFDLRFVPPQGRQLVVRPSAPVRVRAAFRCANGQFVEVQKLAASPIDVRVNDDPDRPVAEQTILLRDWFANHSPFASLGVTIDEITTLNQSPTVSVEVERLQTLTLPIAPPQGSIGAVQLAAASSVEPTTATLLVPASKAKAFEKASFAAAPDAAALAALDAGVPQTLNAALTLPPALASFASSISPASARVTVTVRKPIDTLTLTIGPIEISSQGSELAQYQIAVPEDQRLLRDITLTGPSDAIARINAAKERSTLVWATLRLSPDELAKAATREKNEARPTLVLPAGVTHSALPLITYTVTQKKTAAPPTN